MKIKKLGVFLRVVQIFAIGASAGLVPLAIMSPWIGKSVGDYYSGFYFDLYLGVAYFIPVFYFLVIKVSLNEYDKYLIRRSNTQKLRHCIICGRTNDYKVNFCTYCGNLFSKTNK